MDLPCASDRRLDEHLLDGVDVIGVGPCCRRGRVGWVERPWSVHGSIGIHDEEIEVVDKRLDRSGKCRRVVPCQRDFEQRGIVSDRDDGREDLSLRYRRLGPIMTSHAFVRGGGVEQAPPIPIVWTSLPQVCCGVAQNGPPGGGTWWGFVRPGVRVRLREQGDGA